MTPIHRTAWFVVLLMLVVLPGVGGHGLLLTAPAAGTDAGPRPGGAQSAELNARGHLDRPMHPETAADRGRRSSSAGGSALGIVARRHDTSREDRHQSEHRASEQVGHLRFVTQPGASEQPASEAMQLLEIVEEPGDERCPRVTLLVRLGVSRTRLPRLAR
jgi:hypothetical protein